ncbi:MAG: hypothetical protein N3A72_02725 [bacterium]|nr:hypothetical protein [bacterium]
MSKKLTIIIISFYLLLPKLVFSESATVQQVAVSRVGYTIHFNSLRTVDDAKKSIAMAEFAGAGIVNIVPPAHIWSQPTSVQVLDTLFAECKARNIRIILTRIDANTPDGKNYLYQQILTPVDKTGRVFSIVANPEYEEWLQQETAYYANRYGREPNLAGFCIGGFAGFLDSIRAGVLVWNDKTKRYEIGQYTEVMKRYWQQWLLNTFETMERINEEYQTQIATPDEIPLPQNPMDKRFGLPHRAYFDFISALNSWWWKQYNYNRNIWQQSSKTPFILQLNGLLVDTLIKGHPEYAAFNLPAWLSNADALGISLYTDTKLADTGFGSLYAMTNIIHWAKELGKPIYILESGVDKNNAGFDLFQLRYITYCGLPLNPKSILYEHFREQKAGQSVRPGVLYQWNWNLNLPNSTSITRTFSNANRILSEGKAEPRLPYVYVITYPKLLRDDILAKKFYSMLYMIATFVPIRLVDIKDITFIPANQIVLIAPSWKSELPEIYQRNIIQLAKRRSWLLMTDEYTYPQIQRLLGKEIPGATLDLAGYMKSVDLDIAARGFGKALGNFYIAQKKNAPNGILATAGLAYIPLSDGIKIFCTQPVEVLPLDAGIWGLGEKEKIKPELQVTIYRRDGQPTPVKISLPVIPQATLKTVRWSVVELAGSQKTTVPAKTVKNTIEFTARNGIEYLITQTRQTRPTAGKK